MRRMLALLAAGIPAALAVAQSPAPSSPTAAPAPAGYIPAGTVELSRVLPPAPRKGDIRYDTDRRVFRAMQRQVGGQRWAYATNDVRFDTPSMLHDFACATGVELSREATPATYRLLENAAADTTRANNAAKQYWQRLRPFWIDHGKTCESLESLGKSLDYPSGHTTKGWTLGLLLAELMPDRATPILTRARAYGESRIVCGVHNMSAVEAGRIGATTTLEPVRASPAFQADLAAAHAELARVRATLPQPAAAQCAADEAVLGPSVLAGLTK